MVLIVAALVISPLTTRYVFVTDQSAMSCNARMCLIMCYLFSYSA